MSNLTVYNEAPLTAADIKGQVNLIQSVMKEVMHDGEHYGVIPGCGNKPALLKAGAEKLAFTFRLATDVEVEAITMPREHMEYRVKVTVSTSAGQKLGAGVGSCSTMESKYRFRTGPTELTEQAVPKSYWDLRKSNPAEAQKLLGGKGFVAKKNDEGTWVIAIQGEKVEHDNPADFYNTCLKMAKKRALVDAVLTTTAASDIFTQDIEESPELYGGKPAQSAQEAPKSAPQGTNEDQQGVTSITGEPKAKEGQIKLLFVKIKAAGLTEEDFKAHYKIQRMADIAMNAINGILKDLESGVVKKADIPFPDNCPGCGKDHPKSVPCEYERQPGEEG